MNIEVIGRKVNLKDSFKERVDKKLAKFSRLFHEDASATEMCIRDSLCTGSLEEGDLLALPGGKKLAPRLARWGLL